MKALNIFFIKLIICLILKCAKSADDPMDPCENFYKYACSNYSQLNPDPNYSEITQKLDYEINKKLWQILNKKSRKPFDDTNIQTLYEKMLIYFDACESETRRNLRKYFNEIKPSNNLNLPLWEHKDQWLAADENEKDIIIHNYLERRDIMKISWRKLQLYTEFDSWFILKLFKRNETTVKQFDFWSLLGDIQSYGLNNVIVNHQIIRNKDNSLNIWLTPAFLEEKGSLPDTTILQVLLMALGIEDTEPLMQQLNRTDLKWQNLTQNYADIAESKETTLDNISELYPRLSLKLYIENLLGSELNNLTNITLGNPEYFEYLNGKQWTNEELEHLCNYLMIKFLFYLAEDSTSTFTPLDCIKDLRRKFDLAVNYVYSEVFYKGEAIQFSEALNNIWFKIKAVMVNIFEENYLGLSEPQIVYLKEKLAGINANTGNLPRPSYSNLQDFYKDLAGLEDNNYYKNHLLLLKQRFRKSLYYAQTQTHFIVSDNRMGGVSSPFYALQQNMVIIPFGSFQLPLFNYTQTPLQQLSLFGFVLAHELTHAFDTTGLNYDKQGFPLTFYSDIMDHSNFSKSIECMQHQQSTDDIDERIADLLAVRVAYRTYLENYAKDDGETDDWRKEFFLNLAQFFCGKDNINFIEHDSDAVRVQQMLMNFQPFSETFGCLDGSTMNPKTKCRLY
ncbi:neprilysin-like [Lucilia cuprina]|uniref:neprilysin-like n=1 Tax=Lucilia cuprina TaxID=7375 RepID=UPI001F05AC76|nr:neprilysin-like [Lucilia cuprina]